MRRFAIGFAIGIVAVVLGVWAVSANAFELGTGLVRFSDSEETSPFAAVVLDAAPRVQAQGLWVRDGLVHHADASIVLAAYGLDNIMLFVQGGAGLAWDDFDQSEVEVLYGAGVSGAILGFTGRFGYLGRTQEGLDETENSWFAGLFLNR